MWQPGSPLGSGRGQPHGDGRRAARLALAHVRELKPASIRVLAADGIPYHRREGIAALSAELAADAARAGGDNQGGLAKILLELESKLFTYAYRCRNDCEGNGV